MGLDITRRSVLGTLGDSAIGVALAACGSGSGSGGSVTLEMAHYEAPPQLSFTSKVLTAFKRQTHIGVNVDSLPGSGAAIYPGKLRTELLGGKAPDISRCWGGRPGCRSRC